MLALIRWQARNLAVPLSQLTPPTPMSQPGKLSKTSISGGTRGIGVSRA